MLEIAKIEPSSSLAHGRHTQLIKGITRCGAPFGSLDVGELARARPDSTFTYVLRTGAANSDTESVERHCSALLNKPIFKTIGF